MAEPGRKGGVSLLLVPEDGTPSRSLHLTPTRRRVAKWLAVILGGVLALMAISWGWLAKEAVAARELRREVEALRAERERVSALAARLDSLEQRYDRVRGLFGGDTGSPVSLGPGLPGGPVGEEDAADPDGRPTSWPLTVAGWITQPLLEGSQGEHPGLDIAVPADSYIRAAGPGRVVEVGEEDVYGRYLVLEHDGGYRTLYAHASVVLAEEGRNVRRHEVIALSGSTGRSTAPHLHFEIQLDGETVDPLTLVQPPS